MEIIGGKKPTSIDEAIDVLDPLKTNTADTLEYKKNVEDAFDFLFSKFTELTNVQKKTLSEILKIESNNPVKQSFSTDNRDKFFNDRISNLRNRNALVGEPPQLPLKKVTPNSKKTAPPVVTPSSAVTPRQSSAVTPSSSDAPRPSSAVTPRPSSAVTPSSAPPVPSRPSSAVTPPSSAPPSSSAVTPSSSAVPPPAPRRPPSAGQQVPTRGAIKAKIEGYNEIQPQQSKIVIPSFLSNSTDPNTTTQLVDAVSQSVNAINGLIKTASIDVKTKTEPMRATLKSNIKKFKDRYNDSGKDIPNLEPDPGMTGGKRKRNKKIGTKKKQYKRK
jgi:hypothetical protein